MSAEAVLYDVPGPRAKRRALIGTVVAALVLVAMLGVAGKRLYDRGQFSMELWGPLIDPSNEVFGRVWELLLEGLRATLTAAVLAIIFSLIVGTALGVARMMLPPFFKAPVVIWIELFRGLPVVITIVFVWRAFVEQGIDLTWLPGSPGLWYLVIGLTLYNSVIIAEILRSGVAALPAGQTEAARAVGMTELQAMTTVRLPQAFRIMLPALISQLVVVLKDTSLVAVAGAFFIEFLRRGNLLSQTLDNPIQILTVVGGTFILINYALGKLAEWTERRLSRSRTSSAAAADLSQSATAGA